MAAMWFMATRSASTHRLIIQVGNGMRNASDSVDFVDPDFQEDDGGDIDEFEEVTEPEHEQPAEPAHGDESGSIE